MRLGYCRWAWVTIWLLAVSAQAIVIGQGPAIGTDKKGVTWYQELQDWDMNDVRALDGNDDEYKFNNYADTGRDIIAFYSHDDGTNVYFRVDLFELGMGWESSEVDLYVAIDCASGGQEWLPDYTDTKTDHPWEVCLGVYNSSAFTVYDKGWTNHPADYLGSYWRADLDGVEFGIRRSLLISQGWNGSSALNLQVFTCRDGTQDGAGEINKSQSDLVDFYGTLVRGDPNLVGSAWLNGAIASSATAGRAKYAVIAHGNQSLNEADGIQWHLFSDYSAALKPGMIRLLDTAEMLRIPVNLHISGSLLMALRWAQQDPTAGGTEGWPNRDGPTFLNRCFNFVTNGPGALIGGVLAEHIMPYFEGPVNQKSIQQNTELIQHLAGLSVGDLKVMHTPERVIRSQTNHSHVSTSGPLDGKTFEDILAGGYQATYLDEVTHLHWWFYSGETNNAGWDDNNWGRWAGGEGNDEETYHHKVHKINGVYCFMINDREDQAKFGNDNEGMRQDTRYTLLQKARHPDYAQLTLVFDDWEAYAGNSFATLGQPNGNADQIHNTLRWAANHPWIEFVTLKQVLQWATNDAAWVVDHGYVYDKTSQTYEWLKHASEQDYDHWYYGDPLEESFFERVPKVHNNWSPVGMKKYGDLNTTNTLLRDSWDTIQQIACPDLKKLSEWAYSAMIYETAWHDENAPQWWPPADKTWLQWADAYKSRNYQVTFARPDANSYADDYPVDVTSGWALKLHGHVRDMGVMKEAADWVQRIRNGMQGAACSVYQKDLDDDTMDEYVLCNNLVFLCFERWGARLIKAFIYDANRNGGDAVEVVGAPVGNPAGESDEEYVNENRCSAFKEHYATGTASSIYADKDFAAAPEQGPNFWGFAADDGQVIKRITLEPGRPVVHGEYAMGAALKRLYTRHGLGPNQLDLMLNGQTHLVKRSDPSFSGLKNTQGGECYVVLGSNTSFSTGALDQAGWNNRNMPLTEQFETFNNEGQLHYSLALAFSEAAARDLDGDGLDNTNEWALGCNHERADTDGDGLPDGYEVGYQLNPLSAGDAHGDADSDGASNFEEFIANTRPNNSNSVLRLASIALVNSQVRIQSVTTSNRQFAIEYADAAGGLTHPLAWRGFNNSNNTVGSWMETRSGENSFTFTDDFSVNTSGGNPTNGFRVYRVKVVVP